MRTLLQLDSSPMGDGSVSRKLTAEFAKSWTDAHPDGIVVVRDLTELDIPIVNNAWVAAARTPESGRSEELNRVLAVSDSLISDLQQADEYVVGVPMHNFGIPSTLKLWIDQVVRAGKTFVYTSKGPQGLLVGKKATLLMASGGVYDPGTALAELNFVTPYMRTVFGFIGITDVTIISARGDSPVDERKDRSARLFRRFI